MSDAEFEASVRRRWEEMWNQIRNRPVVNGAIAVSGTEFAAALKYVDAVHGRSVTVRQPRRAGRLIETG